jgi:hypothetical protein
MLFIAITCDEDASGFEYSEVCGCLSQVQICRSLRVRFLHLNHLKGAHLSVHGLPPVLTHWMSQLKVAARVQMMRQK